ncbi:hypothetical protein TNCV_4566901 [Trichonephila clavipes]|nr:hypothetical protein TNCV_4566901 [Trichonephila clavipes]
MFGENAITSRTCQRWFPKFRLGEYSLVDELRLRRPADVSDQVLRIRTKRDPILTSPDVGVGLKTLPYPAYFLDVVPSDYRLSMSLQNFLHRKEHTIYKGTEMAVEEHFASKIDDFFSKGLDKLPESWLTVVTNIAHYISD